MITTHRVTSEARYLPIGKTTLLFRAFRLVAVEGITFSQPLPIESIQVSDHGDGFHTFGLSVWHDQAWMFGIDLTDEDVVTWEYEGPDDEYLEIPKPPDRTNQVRVHGTWHARGEVAWAPDGHPIKFPLPKETQ